MQTRPWPSLNSTNGTLLPIHEAQDRLCFVNVVLMPALAFCICGEIISLAVDAIKMFLQLDVFIAYCMLLLPYSPLALSRSRRLELTIFVHVTDVRTLFPLLSKRRGSSV